MKLIFKYMGMHFKSQIEYKSSFILSFIAQFIILALSACMVFILIDKFQFMGNYNMYQIILSITIVQFGFSFSECFGRGFDKFSDIIKHGTLDLMLVKPRSIYMQVFGNKIAFTKISRVLGSLILFIISINHLSFPNIWLAIIMLIIMIISSSIIYASLYILSACFCFKTIEGLEFFNIFTDGSREFGQYPMSLFKKEVLIMFTYIIPIACVNYYPVMFILGKSNNILHLLCPLYSLVLFSISIIIFNKCIRHYESCGS